MSNCEQKPSKGGRSGTSSSWNHKSSTPKTENGGKSTPNSSLTNSAPMNVPASRFLQNSASENFFCLRRNKNCTRPRLEGQKVCLQHMKLVRGSTFCRCNYVSSRTGKRCFNITTKSDTGREGFCTNHARLVTFYRRRTAHKNRFRDTADSLLENIETSLSPTVIKSETTGLILSKTARPVLDYYSESSDDERNEIVLDARTGPEDSDIELDESDDPLKHAGAYTTEETVRITLEKLTQLKKTYEAYLLVLKRKYVEKRRNYFRNVKIDAETFGRFSESLAKSYKEKKKFAKLRALRRYGNHYGKEAILYQRAKVLKRRTADKTVQSETVAEICTFVENEEKCTNHTLPSSAYCIQHILHDERQLMYRKCETSHCSIPVCSYIPFSCCWLHQGNMFTDIKKRNTLPPPAEIINVEPAPSSGEKPEPVFERVPDLPELRDETIEPIQTNERDLLIAQIVDDLAKAEHPIVSDHSNLALMGGNDEQGILESVKKSVVQKLRKEKDHKSSRRPRKHSTEVSTSAETEIPAKIGETRRSSNGTAESSVQRRSSLNSDSETGAKIVYGKESKKAEKNGRSELLHRLSAPPLYHGACTNFITEDNISVQKTTPAPNMQFERPSNTSEHSYGRF